MKSLPHLYLVPLSILFLFLLAFRIQDVPFRGEHWAMLYTWIKSGDWYAGLSRVINIEYFGDHRFQPLNSAPMILGYVLFGMSFLPYYLISIFIHIFLALGVLRLKDVFQGIPRTSFKNLIFKYPLEFSVFLVLFSSFEVLFWTYFHYIQIATTLGVFALGWFLEDKTPGKRVQAYLAVVLAALFYEPILCELAVFLGVNGWDQHKKKNRLLVSDFLLPAAFLLLIGSQYLSGTVSKPVSVPPDVSQFNGILLQAGHKDLFEAPGAFFKPLFLLYNFFLLVVHVFKTSAFPSYANRTNIFEMMPIPPAVEAQLPFLMGGTILIFGLCAFSSLFRKWLHERGRVLVVTSLVCFLCVGVIIWGRPGAGHYASVQFRYGFVLVPFLFVIALELLERFTFSKKVYALVLGYLFLVNAASSVLHAERLVKSFSPLSDLIVRERSEKRTSDEVVEKVSKGLMDYSIPAPGHDVFLIYNGRGGLAKFYGKSG